MINNTITWGEFKRQTDAMINDTAKISSLKSTMDKNTGTPQVMVSHHADGSIALVFKHGNKKKDVSDGMDKKSSN